MLSRLKKKTNDATKTRRARFHHPGEEIACSAERAIEWKGSKAIKLKQLFQPVAA
jgi:hypothetical protein